MTAKEYLKQLWWLDREINEKLHEIDYLRAKAEGCSSPEISGMPKGSGGKDKISDMVIKIVDLQTYINMKTDQLIDLRARITKQICGMKNQKSRVILSCRYLRKEKWEDMEKELAYEKSSLMRFHKKALKEFEKEYPEIREL
ncbi:MAG: DUF1492 domain-containing protein [Bacteroidales bacterium]|nr:DUF1492 domain-containing protein [Acidaminococcaceae bacterium]MBR5014508.1 DUF1492 domain-containing protein [Bacteroidales bacterium]